MDTTDDNELSVKTDNEVDHFRHMNSDNSSFLVSEVDFLLGGGETTMVSLLLLLLLFVVYFLHF